MLTALTINACNTGSAATPATEIIKTSSESTNPNAILVDGSSTVGPITQKVADEFQKDNPKADIQVGISGTGGGFKKFCAGKIDIADASRPIKETEIELCRENGIDFIEIPVAFDGVAVMVNLENDFVSCLTSEELKTMWKSDAWHNTTHWSHVRGSFPDEPFVLYGPGTVSGTYDYFTEAIVGIQGESRADFWASEDDDMLVDGIATDKNGLGFFGLSYYDKNRNKLKLVSIDNSQGCVEPNTETVSRGLYQPLSRPLFIYINRNIIEQKEITSNFVSFYLNNAAHLVDDVGYIPLTDALYELAQARYHQQIPGSVFEGLGATVGVSLTDLLAIENNIDQ